MAYYDALTVAWNSSTQPPPGVTGTALSSGMTTQQKINAVNNWTMIGPRIPMIIPTYRIYNLVTPSDFTALSSADQQNVRDILTMGTVDVSSGTLARTRFIATFPSSTQTFANLSGLAATFDTPVVDWCRNNKYPTSNSHGNLSVSDANNAGLV